MGCRACLSALGPWVCGFGVVNETAHFPDPEGCLKSTVGGPRRGVALACCPHRRPDLLPCRIPVLGFLLGGVLLGTTTGIALLQTLVAPQSEVWMGGLVSKHAAGAVTKAYETLGPTDTPHMQTVATVDGILLFVSAACESLFGWDPGLLVGRTHDEMVHRDDIDLVAKYRERDPLGTSYPTTTVYRFRCKSGLYRWIENRSLLVSSPDGQGLVVSSVRDIGDPTAGEVDLDRVGGREPYTGVVSASAFMSRVRRNLSRLEHHSRVVAVLLLGLDRFKLINDSVGHLTSDAVLRRVAQRLEGLLQPHHALARWGGDEFAVVVEAFSAEQAVELGDRIIEAVRVPFVIDDERFVCTTSIGIAIADHHEYSADDLLQEANMALYSAKDQGRNRSEVFTEDLRVRAAGRRDVETMLREAINESRLRVSYQPIVGLQTGTTVAAEALVRIWEPGKSDLIAAERFIVVAEETGLVGRMDDWVLGQVMAQAEVWGALFGNTGFSHVTVNLTGSHVARPGFARSVLNDLHGHGLSTDALQIEVTERVLLEGSKSAMAELGILNGAGVKVGLDDFGIGYSSLSYLRQFPLDFVKIDRSFIRRLGHDSTDKAIVESIIDLAHTLGMTVIAEGIETVTQLEALVELGCDQGQGFYFGEVGSSGSLEEMVLAA